MKRSVYLLVIVICLIAPASEAQTANMSTRAIPDDNLSYPVMITFRDGAQGSGFFISNDKGVYLVTAKHVLFDPAPPPAPNQAPIPAKLHDTTFQLLSYSKDISDPEPTKIVIDLAVLTIDNFRPHPTADVVVVKIGSFPSTPSGEPGTASMITFLPGVTPLQMAKTGIVGANVNAIKTFDKVLVGNDVLILGYPGSIGLQSSPQIDPSRPLLRKGIVAGENLQKHSIVLDCPSYQGNSGGPVLQIERNGFQIIVSLIGVVIEYVPFGDVATHPRLGYSTVTLENSGYSIAESMDPVLELLK